MNSRKPSCFTDDESKAKKTILSSLDIYTEEQLMGVTYFILLDFLIIFQDCSENSSKT